VGSLINLTTTQAKLEFCSELHFQIYAASKAEHWTTAKKILRHVKGTMGFGILYRREDFWLIGPAESN